MKSLISVFIVSLTLVSCLNNESTSGIERYCLEKHINKWSFDTKDSVLTCLNKEIDKFDRAYLKALALRCNMKGTYREQVDCLVGILEDVVKATFKEKL